VSCPSDENGANLRSTLVRLIAELEYSEFERGRLPERSCAVLYQHGTRIEKAPDLDSVQRMELWKYLHKRGQNTKIIRGTHTITDIILPAEQGS
jgi:hypothetical protein